MPPTATGPFRKKRVWLTAIKHFASQAPLFVGDRIDTDITGANRAGLASVLVLTGVSTRKEVLGVGPEGRPKYIIGSMLELLQPYEEPKKTLNGFKLGKTLVELLGNKVVVSKGDPKSLDALKAACAVIYAASTPIYGLDVEPALYE